jgi:transcriptional regulator with XRE-family HTH domain
MITVQVFSSNAITQDYDMPMKTGRPAKSPRTPFGERLHAAREASGLSQAQIAQQFDIAQNAYAMWERHPVALRPDQIEKLAKLLNVSVEYLFGKPEPKPRGGPTGRVRRIFGLVNQLPRNQQQKIVDVVEDMLAARGINGVHRKAA